MKGKFFWRRLIKFIIIMIIPTMILYGAFLLLNIYAANKSLDQEGSQSITAVLHNFDLAIGNILHQHNLLTSTTDISSAISRLLNGQLISYRDSLYINNIRSILSSTVNLYSYVDSVYIYLDESPRFFSSYRGIVDINFQEDISWLQIYEGMAPDQQSHIGLRRTSIFGNPESMVIINKMLMQKGCLIVDINIEKLESILQAQLSNEYQTVFIINEDGEVLAQISGEKTDASAQMFLASGGTDAAAELRALTADANGKWTKYEGGRVFVNATVYEPMNLYIVSGISSQAQIESIEGIVQLFVIFLLENLLVVFFLAYITTRRSFKHIQNMIDMFSLAEEKMIVPQLLNQVNDEYDTVMNNIIYLFLRNSYLNTRLENMELMALQLQINPHFLYNTLQTLSFEVQSGDVKPEQLGVVIQDVSDIFKYALSAPQNPVSLREEIEYLKKYTAIQKYRFGDKFIIYYEIPDEALEIDVFCLMLQPVIENSILHGIRNLQKMGYIKVKVIKLNNRMNFYVTDNGIGMSREQIHNLYNQINDFNSRSIGLTNLNRRLVLRYGAKSELRIRSKPGIGTSISFMIPC